MTAAFSTLLAASTNVSIVIAIAATFAFAAMATLLVSLLVVCLIVLACHDFYRVEENVVLVVAVVVAAMLAVARVIVRDETFCQNQPKFMGRGLGAKIGTKYNMVGTNSTMLKHTKP